MYNIAQLSGTANTAALSDKTLYRYVSRNYVPSPFMAGGTLGTIREYYKQRGRGWDKIAIISTSENYGVTLARSLINILEGTPIKLATYQQFISGSNVTVQMREIQNSGARVIVVYAITGDAGVFAEAKRIGLLDNLHVWMVGPAAVGSAATYSFPNGTVNNETIQNLGGSLGVEAYIPRTGPHYQKLLELWTQPGMGIVGTGPGTVPPVFLALTFDMGMVVANAVIEANKQGLLNDQKKPPSAAKWTSIIRNITLEGATGTVAFDAKGDRPMPIAIVNYRSQNITWSRVGYWDPANGTTLFTTNPTIFRDNTTVVPDLDIRSPFDYWSCKDRKKGTDETGKTIKKKKPDGGDFDEIDYTYYCDSYIDCHNLSDESSDGCATNYMAVFIAFGIVTGLLILMTCCLIPFVIVFGFIIPRKRIRASSPVFLLVICFSCILGFSSTYAWYGKPHFVGCNFQPWLLGLGVVSLISALSAKTWRMWRIFRVQFSRAVISDIQLIILYLIMVAPAVIILIIWTIVSTPTAKMQYKSGEDHFICTTGGFTGKPGGLIFFFFILVAYEGLVLLFAAFLSIVTRNVPSFFNESKLIAISIYNLGFLAAVIIPVFLVLQEYNPFAAWIIRTVAILYAFAATLFLQFVPKIIGVLIIDKGKDAVVSAKSVGASTQTASASGN